MTTTTHHVLDRPLLMDTTLMATDETALGSAEKVIYDPGARRAIAVVVHSGRLHPTHRVMPTRHLCRVGALTADTDLTHQQFDALPPFEERDYERPGATLAPPPGWERRQVLVPVAGNYPVSDRPSAPPATTFAVSNEPVYGPGAPDPTMEEFYIDGAAELYGADPYDVLTAEHPAAARTPFEWGDASDINPQRHPDKE